MKTAAERIESKTDLFLRFAETLGDNGMAFGLGDEFTPEQFNELATKLGFNNCGFTKVSHANKNSTYTATKREERGLRTGSCEFVDTLWDKTPVNGYAKLNAT